MRHGVRSSTATTISRALTALRAKTATSAPASASLSAVAAPMPAVPPVTIATWPVRGEEVTAKVSHRSRPGIGKGKVIPGRELSGGLLRQPEPVDERLRGHRLVDAR